MAARMSDKGGETRADLQWFLPPHQKRGRTYTDGSNAFVKSCKAFEWLDDANTPHHPETNGFIEKAVRRVKKRPSSGSNAKVVFPMNGGTWHWNEISSCTVTELRQACCDLVPTMTENCECMAHRFSCLLEVSSWGCWKSCHKKKLLVAPKQPERCFLTVNDEKRWRRQKRR